MLNNIATLLFIILSISATSAKFRAGCDEQIYLEATFDPKYSGGVSGSITTVYHKKNPMLVNLYVDMDMSGLDMKAIQQRYPNCQNDEPVYGWHMHAIWNNEPDSGFLNDCAPSQTGGHYDPTFACGPASQYNRDVICLAQHNQTSYDCNPENYKYNGISCEKADYSGKFGALIADQYGRIKSEYKDFFHPAAAVYNKPVYNEANVQWNILLHVSCPAHNNPLILCARANLN